MIVTNSNSQVTRQNILEIIAGGPNKAGGLENFQKFISGGRAIGYLRVLRANLPQLQGEHEVSRILVEPRLVSFTL